MGDETPNTMNLDLNLGPFPPTGNEPGSGSGSLPNEAVNFEDWINGERERFHLFREAVLFRARRSRQVLRSIFLQPDPDPSEAGNVALELLFNFNTAGGAAMQTGEGSVPTEERSSEVIKTCENNVVAAEDEALGKKEDVERGDIADGCFFDCNICLDLAKNPVVSCCGHLFCWPCLYQWLHVHSDTHECPVCKGEVTVKNVTPIYGRGKNTHEANDDYSFKIPSRPHARRIESWRQTIQRNPFSIEEWIMRLGRRFDLTGDLLQVQPQSIDGVSDSPERNTPLLDQILIAGPRREQNTVAPSDIEIDAELTQSIPTNSEIGESRRRLAILFRRAHIHRAATSSNFPSELGSSERLADSFFRHHHVERNQEQPQSVDDRDSVSSIAAVIHSESQTVDNAVEIDSTVSLSTSSSRRRNDSSRVSDVDSGDSRAHRRRRLN